MKPNLRRRPARSITILFASAAEREAWFAAAHRENLEIREWIRGAAELAIARGSTR